ncbi:MAG: YdcF family protein [Cyanobacteria bacterium P01_F01_bin.42]
MGLTSYFPLRIAIAQFQAPQPEGILTLGGARYREYATARLSRSHPELDIWISSGSLPQESELIFAQMQATTDRVNLDYSATDTLSNFTTILPQLQAANVQHIYLVTSDYHMPRAQAIATVVLGSRGIIVSPVAISSARPKESLGHVMRDVLRSVFWLATGKTGSHLKQANCYGVNELEAVVDLFKPLESQCHQITRQP